MNLDVSILIPMRIEEENSRTIIEESNFEIVFPLKKCFL